MCRGSGSRILQQTFSNVEGCKQYKPKKKEKKTRIKVHGAFLQKRRRFAPKYVTRGQCISVRQHRVQSQSSSASKNDLISLKKNKCCRRRSQPFSIKKILEAHGHETDNTLQPQIRQASQTAVLVVPKKRDTSHHITSHTHTPPLLSPRPACIDIKPL